MTVARPLDREASERVGRLINKLVIYVPTRVRDAFEQDVRELRSLLTRPDGRKTRSSAAEAARQATLRRKRDSQVFLCTREGRSARVVGYGALCRELELAEHSIRCFFSRNGGVSFVRDGVKIEKLKS